MKTGIVTLGLLFLLPCSWAQNPAPPINSLIPGISTVFDNPLGSNLFEKAPPPPQTPSHPLWNPQDAAYPNQFQPQEPGFRFPAQNPLYLSTYQNQPSSGQSRPGLYQPVPNQYQSNPFPSQLPGLYQGNNGYAPSVPTKRYKPEKVLAFLYQIGRAQKGVSPDEYAKLMSTKQKPQPQNKQDKTYGAYPQGKSTTTKNKKVAISPDKQPICRAFLSQFVCKACLAHRPCYHYCC